MPDAFKITLHFPQSLKDKLSPEKFKEVMQAGLTAAAKELKAEASIYPGTSHKPVIWASEKQRRYYFAMRRMNNAPAQYTRQSDPMSQRIAKSWSVVSNSYYSASVVNSADYAGYVIGEQQQPQHKATGWRKIVDVVRQLEATQRLQKVFEKVIHAFINK